VDAVIVSDGLAWSLVGVKNRYKKLLCPWPCPELQNLANTNELRCHGTWIPLWVQGKGEKIFSTLSNYQSSFWIFVKMANGGFAFAPT
jgi:hypothetical protein